MHIGGRFGRAEIAAVRATVGRRVRRIPTSKAFGVAALVPGFVLIGFALGVSIAAAVAIMSVVLVGTLAAGAALISYRHTAALIESSVEICTCVGSKLRR